MKSTYERCFNAAHVVVSLAEGCTGVPVAGNSTASMTCTTEWLYRLNLSDCLRCSAEEVTAEPAEDAEENIECFSFSRRSLSSLR